MQNLETALAKHYCPGLISLVLSACAAQHSQILPRSSASPHVAGSNIASGSGIVRMRGWHFMTLLNDAFLEMYSRQNGVLPASFVACNCDGVKFLCGLLADGNFLER